MYAIIKGFLLIEEIQLMLNDISMNKMINHPSSINERFFPILNSYLFLQFCDMKKHIKGHLFYTFSSCII